jgi:hypothetical protein
MPNYELTVFAYRRGTTGGYTGPDTDFRTFRRYITADTATDARRTLMHENGDNGRTVTDTSDRKWFDSWNVQRVREVARYVVVTTDNTAWHSNGITSESVFYRRGDATTCLRNSLKRCSPGQGAFIRTEPVRTPVITASYADSVHVVMRNAVSQRSAASKCAAFARKHFGAPVSMVSSGGHVHDGQTDYSYVFVSAS